MCEARAYITPASRSKEHLQRAENDPRMLAADSPLCAADMLSLLRMPQLSDGPLAVSVESCRTAASGAPECCRGVAVSCAWPVRVVTCALSVSLATALCTPLERAQALALDRLATTRSSDCMGDCAGGRAISWPCSSGVGSGALELSWLPLDPLLCNAFATSLREL